MSPSDPVRAFMMLCSECAAIWQASPRLTSFIIVMEMTTGHQIVLRLMLTGTVSSVASRLLSPRLYRALAERYVDAPVRSTPAKRADIAIRRARAHSEPR
jgi:H+/Cl- antiporter ClcA